MDESRKTENPEWMKTINEASLSVCQVKFCHSDAVDVHKVLSSEATGFCIDTEHGFILTNRHVAGVGPFWGFVVFDQNHEFCVTVRYSDPIHDFAILQLVKDQRGAEDLKALRLAPEKAVVGVELRLLGNDAGNKLSIGRAEISRIDSNAPDCGYHNSLYFNLNYICAAFSAVGGSSGSAAVNIEREVLALQSAGVISASIDLLQPVDLVQDTLELLRKGQMVTRGTLQTKWSLLPLNECARYKLPIEWQDRFRERRRKNAIRADIVLPEGPADGQVEVGDILLEVEGGLMYDLIPLERHMNNHVGDVVHLKLWRTDRIVEAKCTIGDLHAIVPHRFITRAGVNFHALSYQQALKEGTIPIKGVWVAGSSLTDAFIPHRIIESINDDLVPNLDSFKEIISKYDAGGFIATCHKDTSDINTPIKVADFLPPSRSPTATEWRREPREGGPWKPVHANPKPLQPHCLPLMKQIAKPDAATKEPKNSYGSQINAIFNSIAVVKGYQVVEARFTTWSDWGFIVCKAKGLIMARRGNVTKFSQIHLTLAGKLIVTARITFLHEADNFMLLEYNPADACTIYDQLCDVQFSDTPLYQGDTTYHVSFDCYDKIIIKTTVEVLSDEASERNKRATFVPMSCETISLNANFATKYPAGALLDSDGRLVGMMNPFNSNEHGGTLHAWLPTRRIHPIISRWKQNTLGEMRYQDFSIDFITTEEAVQRGVSREWTSEVEAHDSSKRQMIEVQSVPSTCVQPDGSVVKHPLQCDDIVLTLNGKLVIESSDWTYVYDQEAIQLRIFRDGEEMDVVVPTRAAKELHVDTCVVFCGMNVQKPNLSLLMNQHPCHSELYLASMQSGSPAQLYGLVAGGFITAVNGKERLTLDELVVALESIHDNEYFTLKVFYNNRPRTVTIKKYVERYPSYIIAEDPNAVDAHNPWKFTVLSDIAAAA